MTNSTSGVEQHPGPGFPEVDEAYRRFPDVVEGSLDGNRIIVNRGQERYAFIEGARFLRSAGEQR